MKKLNYTLLLLVAALVGLSSCSQEDDLLNSQNLSAEPVIKVSTTGYESADPTTRATDNEGEFKTTLAENDQIGIYAVKNGRVISKNIPYKYNGTSWGKVSETAVSVVTGDNVSYFAYYPYRSAMDNKTITSVDDILSNFDVAADQNTQPLYTQNDLMTATGILSNKTLSFTLNHALALIVVDLKGQRTPYAGGYAAYSAVSSVTKKQIGNVINPYTDAKGYFRALVKPGSVTPDISYVAGGKTVTYSSAITAVAGKYNKKLIYAGNTTTSEQSITRGDYFYADGNISSTYTKDSNNPCIGIVLTTTEQLETAPYNHGLVVALKDASRKMKNGGIPTDNLPSVPNTCKQWFLPSLDQLKLMVWGNTSTQSTNGKTFLEQKMSGVANSEKFNARNLDVVFYSSTTLLGSYNYWTIVISSGVQQEWSYWVVANGRAIFAF
ncbi:MAG: fimbrillin family protein [Lachnospiraceae bacterium]